MSYRMSDVEISIEACAAAIRAGDDPRVVLGIVATAAEERGRRSGIESAQLAVDAVVAVCDLHQDVQYRNGALMAAEAVRALAPRDSGKEEQ